MTFIYTAKSAYREPAFKKRLVIIYKKLIFILKHNKLTSYIYVYKELWL